MKITMKLLALGALIVVAQACGKKSETVADETVADKDTVSAVVELTPAEKRAKLEAQTAERAERRRLAWEERAKTSPSFKDDKGNVIYYKAEKDPSFEGGEQAISDYLSKNIQYPKDAEEQGLEGTVFVDFVVAKDGQVKQVEVTEETNEDVSPSFRAEAVRVVSSMPKWVPGTQAGKKVDVKYSLPITFRMM